MSRRLSLGLLAVAVVGAVSAAIACAAEPEGDAPAAPEAGAPSPDATAAETNAPPPDGAPGCSIDVQADPKNCGSCGHDCLGGACSAGRCVPTVLALGQKSPAALALDDTHVYFQSAKDGLISRVPKSGGSAEAIVKPSTFGVALVVDATDVYFLAGTSDRVLLRAPKTGLPDGGSPASARMAKTAVGLGFSFPVLASDGNNVYFAFTNVEGMNNQYVTYVSRTPKGFVDAGPPAGELTKTPLRVTSLAVDDAGVYFTEATYVNDSLPAGNVVAVRTDLDASADGSAVRLTTGQGEPGGIAVDRSNVYWANAATGTVKAIKKTGGGPEIIAPGRYTPASVAVDTTTVYWVDVDGRRVVACAIAGCAGSARILAEDQAEPTALAIDATAVYWVNREGGNVMKVAK